MASDHLVLHQHPFASFCWKATIALHDLELSFTTALVEGAEGREDLARMWPIARMPILEDRGRGLVLPESTTIVEHLDRIAPGASRLIPGDPDDAREARLWDRILDQYVQLPMQRIVAEELRPSGDRDPYGVREAREKLDSAYATLEQHLPGRAWVAGAAFTMADCAAAPALFYARVVHPWDEATHPELTRVYGALMHRPAVHRVIEDARPYRGVFPLPWPADVDAHRPVGGAREAIS